MSCIARTLVRCTRGLVLVENLLDLVHDWLFVLENCNLLIV